MCVFLPQKDGKAQMIIVWFRVNITIVHGGYNLGGLVHMTGLFSVYGME